MTEQQQLPSATESELQTAATPAESRQERVPILQLEHVIRQIQALDNTLTTEVTVVDLVGYAGETWYGWSRKGQAPKSAWWALRGYLSQLHKERRPHPLDYFTMDSLKAEARAHIEADDYTAAGKMLELIKWCEEDKLTNAPASREEATRQQIGGMFNNKL